MMKEEEILFPLIRKLDEHGGPSAWPTDAISGPISVMEHEHDSADPQRQSSREPSRMAVKLVWFVAVIVVCPRGAMRVSCLPGSPPSGRREGTGSGNPLASGLHDPECGGVHA